MLGSLSITLNMKALQALWSLASTMEPYQNQWGNSEKSREAWDQMQFNLTFLRKEEEERGLTCSYCKKKNLRIYHWRELQGQRAPVDTATADHVIPKAKGGPNTFENLVVACQPCNGLKGSK